MRIIDRATGEPKFQYRCCCGVDKRVHLPQCSGVVVAEPIYKLRRLLPFLHNQWVICRWNAPLSMDGWKARFGSALEYPANGYLMPVDGPHGGVIALQPNVMPDEEVTWEFVRAVKKDRQKTAADWINQSAEALDLQERRADDLLDSNIRDSNTAFGNVPGSRSTGVSLPTKEYRQNFDKVLSV